MEYTKLPNLVNKDFTVLEAYGYEYKKYDPDSRRFITSETYQEGFRKTYTIKTDAGKLDLGSGQLASLLEAVYRKGEANIINKTFHVKSNGKTGLDIRYYFNPVRSATPNVRENRAREDGAGETTGGVLDGISDSDNINIDDIPF